jgi:hypothetical protein
MMERVQMIIMKNLKQLLGFCEHKWKIIETFDIYRYINNAWMDKPYAHKYILQCEKCGKIKKQKI